MAGEKEVSRIIPISIGVILIFTGTFFLFTKLTIADKK